MRHVCTRTFPTKIKNHRYHFISTTRPVPNATCQERGKTLPRAGKLYKRRRFETSTLGNHAAAVFLPFPRPRPAPPPPPPPELRPAVQVIFSLQDISRTNSTRVHTSSPRSEHLLHHDQDKIEHNHLIKTLPPTFHPPSTPAKCDVQYAQLIDQIHHHELHFFKSSSPRHSRHKTPTHHYPSAPHLAAWAFYCPAASSKFSTRSGMSSSSSSSLSSAPAAPAASALASPE